MIRRYRLRRIATRQLQLAFAGFLLGQLTLILGLGLSFKNLIRPALAFLSQSTTRSMSEIVPEDQVASTAHLVGGFLIIVGVVLSVNAFMRGIRDVVHTLTPDVKQGRAEMYFRRLELAQGPRIVAIGGGTGLSTLLRGLKQQTSNITAIVTVTDDGGSSGRLMREKGIIPPGDLRNCMVALADAEKTMTDLFQHRFKDDSGSLSGHSIGNLLIAALADQAKGNFDEAVAIASAVLNIRGTVVPSTLDHVELCAEFEDGSFGSGETSIVGTGKSIQQLRLNPADCEPHPIALEAIREADLICIGPGSVFTSVIPNLIVPGITAAIMASPAPKVYICNVMTQPGESDGLTASDHAGTITRIVGSNVIDFVLVNTTPPSAELLERYEGSNQHVVEPDLDQIRKRGFRPLPGDYISESDFVRHDPFKVTARLLKLLERR
jgi:uncharacterized cofD-like protein